MSRSPSPEFSPLTVDPGLIPLPSYKEASTTTISFSDLLSSPLRLHEDLSSGCGGQLWPAGMVLAKHMLRYHHDDLKDAKMFVGPTLSPSHFFLRSCPVSRDKYCPVYYHVLTVSSSSLEIGAGGGLVGLAVALGCTVDSPILITDQAAMLPLMTQNVALNGLEDRVVPLELNWGDPLPPLVKAHQPTIVLAADCVYFEPAFPLLLATLVELLDLMPCAKVYFCFKKRRRADMQFMKSARKLFLVEDVMDEDRGVWRRDNLFLYLLKRKDTAMDGV
jgi:protein N-lysine methyltransferase METTL21A